MLELDGNSFFDNMRARRYAEGYCEGLLLGRMHTCRIYEREKRNYDKYVDRFGVDKVPDEIRKSYKTFCKIIDENTEKNRDLMTLYRKYEALSDEAICNKIWLESEYWHND